MLNVIKAWELYLMTIGLGVFFLCVCPIRPLRRLGLAIASTLAFQFHVQFTLGVWSFTGLFAGIVSGIQYMQWHMLYIAKARPTFRDLGMKQDYLARKWRAERDLYMWLLITVLYMAIHGFAIYEKRRAAAVVGRRSG